VQLSQQLINGRPQWLVDGRLLEFEGGLSHLLSLAAGEMIQLLSSRAISAETGAHLPPIEPLQEVWAAGVTYLRSRQEREAESTVADVYATVYEADRPEIFFKAPGYRVVGSGELIRIRTDSTWNVPEPELTLVINRHAEIVGYTAGNDVSSRSIEGENPLYLPQAKCYDGACALGPSIVVTSPQAMRELPIECEVGDFHGTASTAQMRRSFEQLVSYLFRETSFPNGVFLMTGTGIVPSPDFTLKSGDSVRIRVGELELVNTVA